jgi:uncharacterized membrane protein YczE
MEKNAHSGRLLDSRQYYFWIGGFFMLVFFGLFFLYKWDLSLGSSSAYTFFSKYWMYLPLAIGWVSILVSYILLVLTSMFRVNFFITKLLIYLIVYGFWLYFAVQLRYFEPRYTDIAKIIIDTYAFPLLLASGATLILVVLLSFFHTNKKHI